MEAWKLLLGSDIGLLSLFTIGFMLVMAGGFKSEVQQRYDASVAAS